MGWVGKVDVVGWFCFWGLCVGVYVCSFGRGEAMISVNCYGRGAGQFEAMLYITVLILRIKL